MTTSPQLRLLPADRLEALVRTHVDLTERIEALNAERANIVAQLRELGPGKYDTSFGVSVTVALPSRSFNATKAWSMLTPEQQAVCVSPDAKKIKQQLAPVLAEQCMDEGTGEPRVTVR